LFYVPSLFVARRDTLLAMTVLLLLILSPTASGQAPVTPASPPPPLIEGKIARIDVKGNVHVSTQDIVEKLKGTNSVGLLDLGKGSIAHKPLDVDAVKGMGVFSSVTVTTSPDLTGGTDVICTVVENPVVKAIKFTANTPDGKPTVPEADLLARMHTAIGQVMNSKTLVQDITDLFDHNTGYVRSQGYLCDVSTDINIDPDTGILTIPLIEAFIDKINIQGNGPVPTTDILSTLRIKPGDLLDFNTVQQGLIRLAGMHRFAEIDDVQFTPTQIGKVALAVTVRVPRSAVGTVVTSSKKSVSVSYGGPVCGPIIVPVRVNDHTTGHFLLVTSSDLSEISSTFATSLGLTPQPLLVDGQPYLVSSQPAMSVSLNQIALGGTPGIGLGNLSLPVVDLSDMSKQIGQTIDGIIGSDLLSQIAVGIDFPRRQITFWDHGSLSADERRAAGFGEAAEVPVLPIYGGTSPLALSTHIQNGAVTRDVQLIIATGSQTSLLPTADSQALGMTPLPNPNDPATLLSRPTRLNFGGLTLNAPLFQFTSNIFDTTLGMNVLSQYRVLLDGPTHTAYFAPEVTVAGVDPNHKSMNVPFQFDHLTTPLVVIQVSIDGRPPLPFIFDSGFSYALTIDRQVAQRLGLTVDDGPGGVLNGSIPVQTAPVLAAVLQGSTPGDNVKVSLEQAIVADLSFMQDAIPERHIAGIIGAGILQNMAVRFDFPTHLLTFYPASAGVSVTPHTVTLPLSENLSEGAFFTNLSTDDGKSMRLLVDTGSEETNIPYEMRASVRPSATAVSARWMLGSMALGQFLLLPRLTFNGMSAENLTVSVIPTSDTPGNWSPGTLGIDLLSQMTVTLDIPRMRLLLGPPSAKIPAFRGGWVGIRLAQEEGQFKITQVLPASPAFEAGLKVGDILTTIDGRSLASLSLFNVRNLADGIAGTPAVFVIRRGNASPLTVRFRRSNINGDPPSPLNGIYGRREAANPFVVDAIVPSCPAARAGLVAGDTITQINGLATQTLTTVQWQTILQETHLTLAVTHKGKARTVVLVNAPSDLKNSYPPTGKIAASGQEK
jgi:membrane-associated protease RseP (regulator of RpoE activity)